MIISIGNEFFMWWSSISFNHDEKWWKNNEFWLIYVHPSRIWGPAEFNPESIEFRPRLSRKFSTTPCTVYRRGWGYDQGIRLTFKIDSSVHRDDRDKPSWFPSDWEVFERFWTLIWPLTVFKHSKIQILENMIGTWPRHDRGIRLIFKIDFSVHRDDRDKPSWFPGD